MWRWMTAAGLVAVIASGTASAQQQAGRTERTQVGGGLGQEKPAQQADPRDPSELRKIAARYKAATIRRDVRMLEKVEAELRRHLAAEIREGKAELARPRPDAAQDERRDQPVSTERGGASKTTPVLRLEQNERSRRLALAAELDGLLGRRETRAYVRVRQILSELHRLKLAEVSDAPAPQETRSERR